MVQLVVDFNRAEHLVRHLAAALGSRRLYGVDHRKSQEALRGFAAHLRGFFRENPSAERFCLGIRGGQVTHEGIPVGSGTGNAQLATRLEGLSFSGLEFSQDVRAESIAAFLDWLDDESSKTPEDIAGIDLLRHSGEEDVPVDEELPSQLEPFRIPTRIYRNTADVLQKFFSDITWNREPNFEEVMEISRWTSEESFRLGARLLAPVQLLRQDSYTYQHSVNVFLISTVLLQTLARDPQELTGWARAALLHDIGKARVPAEILGKKGALTAEEFAFMRRHTEFGAQILMECGETDPLAVEVAYCHHMRGGGYGYPDPRPGLRPGPVTNVIQVADMFEALCSRRPYKAACKVGEALRIILETPGMESKRPALQVLLARLTHSPPGSEVLLSSGERGMVLDIREDDPAHPVVLLFSDCEGVALPNPVQIDLADAPPAFGGKVRRVVDVDIRSAGLACTP